MAKHLKEKLSVLKEFEIEITPDEIVHLRELSSEIAIDNFVRVLFDKYL